MIVIEIWQAVLMLIGGMALVCVLLYVAAWLICGRTAIHGLMRVSVAWNRWPDGRIPEGVDAPLMENGSYLISMTDPPGLDAEDRFIGTLSFWDRIKPRRYSVAKLLDRYRHCYECAGFYNDAADNLLSDLERNLVDLGTLRGSFDGKSFTVSRDKGRQCKVRAAGKKNSGGKVTAYTVCRDLEPRYGDRDGFLAKNICITIEYLDQGARTARSGKTEVGK